MAHLAQHPFWVRHSPRTRGLSLSLTPKMVAAIVSCVTFACALHKHVHVELWDDPLAEVVGDRPPSLWLVRSGSSSCKAVARRMAKLLFTCATPTAAPATGTKTTAIHRLSSRRRHRPRDWMPRLPHPNINQRPAYRCWATVSFWSWRCLSHSLMLLTRIRVGSSISSIMAMTFVKSTLLPLRITLKRDDPGEQ